MSRSASDTGSQRLDGALEELRGHHHGLWLVAARQDDRLTEKADLVDDFGQVVAGLGDSESLRGVVAHASRIHTGLLVQGSGLYNSGMDDFPRHFPLRKVDPSVPGNQMLAPSERRPEGYLKLWHIVYRFYDAEKNPVYIGSTSTEYVRLATHRRQSPWWDHVEYVAISAYESEDAMVEAERAAIRSEKPRFNKLNRRGPQRATVDLHLSPRLAAEVLHRDADPAFISELARLLDRPDDFPRPLPPPPIA